MGDVYKEQLVVKKPSMADTLKRAGIVFCAFIIAAACFIFAQTFFALVVIAVGFGAYYLFSFLKLEYEYIFTNGELDIDCIYAQSRRKKKFNGEVKNCEIMCHVSEKGYDSMFNTAEVTRDYSSGVVSNNTYMFLISSNNKKCKIIFEPNDELLQAMKIYVGINKLIIKK